MSRFGAVAGVLTLAVGAIVAAAVFGLTFVLEAQARDASHALERQTAIVGAAARVTRAVDLMMAVQRVTPGSQPADVAREQAERRREYEEALDRLKRLVADDAHSQTAAHAESLQQSIDDWQRVVTVPLLQGRRGPAGPVRSPDAAPRAARIRTELSGLEAGVREHLSARQSAVERIAVRERRLGRWLAAAVALGLIVASALRWRKAWAGAPS